MLQRPKELEGVLLVDKPGDHTSHDVVARLRKKLQMKRIGHAGTLDPMATGVLVMLVGKATKASQYLMSMDKVYTGTIKLGETTNTQDADGEVITTLPVPTLDEAQIKATLLSFKGDQYQTPPMFSAIKIDGVPLYKHARKGEEVEREPRFIRVMDFSLTGWATPLLDFSCHCTKGTYVRTLAHDVGEKLGCGGHLTALRRTASGNLTIDRATRLEDLLEMSLAEIETRLLAVRDVVPVTAL